MKRLSKSDTVKFEFSSSEEIEDILKLHKVNFEKLAGSNNRNSNWFNHPKRKPLYQILPALAFAMKSLDLTMDMRKMMLRASAIEFSRSSFGVKSKLLK